MAYTYNNTQFTITLSNGRADVIGDCAICNTWMALYAAIENCESHIKIAPVIVRDMARMSARMQEIQSQFNGASFFEGFGGGIRQGSDSLLGALFGAVIEGASMGREQELINEAQRIESSNEFQIAGMLFRLYSLKYELADDSAVFER